MQKNGVVNFFHPILDDKMDLRLWSQKVTSCQKLWCKISYLQGVQSPEEMKFPDFSRLRLNPYVYPRLLRGIKIKMLRLVKMNFTKQNSLTFP